MKTAWPEELGDPLQYCEVPSAELPPIADEPPPAELSDYGLGEGDVILAPAEPLDFVDPTAWEGEPIPERQWLVRDRIPAGNVSLLGGDGAAGKTTAGLQLVAAVPRGSYWLGAKVEQPGQVVFFSAEEDYDEIHRRLGAILARDGLAYAELAGVHLFCCPGDDAVLGAPDRGGIIRPSKLYDRLAQSVVSIRPALVVIESAADVYAGNENDRSQVRQFIALLRRMARDSGAAVLLLAHPSVAGMATGTGTSGSTGWNNSVRSRLYLKSIKGDGEDGEDENLRELVVMKSNYGPKGEAVRLRWDRGGFAPDGGLSPLDRIAAEAAIDHAFLKCLDTKNAQGIPVSHLTGRNYAPAIFEGMTEAKGFKRKAMAISLERLLSAHQLKVETSGPPSKQRAYLVRT